MPGKVLAAVAHAGKRKPMAHALGEQGHDARVPVKRAIPDHLRMAIVEIEHRRETEVDTASTQFGSQDVARRGCNLGGQQHILVPKLAQPAHGRQHGEAIGAKALHAPAFMIDRDEEVLAHGTNRIGQRGELRAIFEVPCEQDDAARHWVRKTPHIVVVEYRALDIEHDRPGNLLHRFISVTKK